jgi:bacterial/archaeal transporter family-2 protein
MTTPADQTLHYVDRMLHSSFALAVWTLLAGAGIPLIGVLNSGMARALGSPLAATAVMFAVALVVALALSLPLYGLSGFGEIGSAPLSSYGAGMLIGFYALSATIIIPRFGAGNFVAFILVAQLATAAAIDQFGLFGMAKQPLGALRLAGFCFILAGITLIQLASKTLPRQ